MPNRFPFLKLASIASGPSGRNAMAFVLSRLLKRKYRYQFFHAGACVVTRRRAALYYDKQCRKKDCLFSSVGKTNISSPTRPDKASLRGKLANGWPRRTCTAQPCAASLLPVANTVVHIELN